MDQQEPKRVADFVVDYELQRDFIGRSYLARRAPGQAHVRLLLVASQWGSGESQAMRLRRLMQALAEVKSPALLRWLTCKPLADQQLCVVSEWASGQPFLRWLQTTTEPQLLEALRQVAALLASAHAMGIAHGLLNPGQLTVSTNETESPQIHLHDLGLLAALLGQPTSADVDAAAQSYLAPEQRRAGAELVSSAAADVYALGVLASQTLAQVRTQNAGAGALPGEARTEKEFLAQLVREVPGDRPAMAVVASVLQRWAGHAAAPAMKNTEPNLVLSPSAEKNGAGENSRTHVTPGAGRLPHVKIGNFRFIRELGSGGMGTVYEAVHEQIERRVAIKIMNAKLAKNQEFKERFLREARAANMVTHRSLVQITDFGSTEDGALYLVMEFVSGESLAHRLAQHPNGLALPQVLHIAYDLARALAVLHAAHIVHRDLKPENIMMVGGPAEAGESEQVKILDFGIAKLMQRPDTDNLELTGVGRTMGSPEFMAPEQFIGAGAVDAKADVFSLALLVCVMVSGQRPFAGFSWAMLNPEHVVKVEVPATLPPHLRQLVVRMLAVDPKQRPTMAEFAQALKPRTFNRLPLFAGVAGVMALGAVMVYQHFSHKEPRVPKTSYITLTQQAAATLRAGCGRTEPLLRTAAVNAIAHAGQPEYGSLLVPMLQDPIPEVRAAAGLALAKLAPASALTELRRLAEMTPMGEVQVEAAAALLRLGDQQGASILRRRLEPPIDQIYYLGALRLCAAKDAPACGALKGLLDRRLDEIPELEALYTLAASGDQSAVLAIRQKMERAPSRMIQLGAAQRLTRLRGPEADGVRARVVLEKAAALDLTAAVLVSQIHSDAGVDLLTRRVTDSQTSLASRIQAAEALGDSGFIERGLAALTPLTSAQTDSALQLSAAGSILLLVNPSRQEDLAALSALTGRSSLLAWIGDIPNDAAKVAVNDFAQLGKEDRRLVAITLRQRALVQSVEVLMASLDDVDPAVQLEGSVSLKHILAVLMQRQADFGRDAVLRKLERLRSSKRPVDQVVAASILAQLGEKESAIWIQELYSKSSEEGIRALIINLAQPVTDRELLVTALGDRSALVRFGAARRLAEAGDRRAQQVLLADGLNSGGSRALIAYSLLVRLGIEVPGRARALDWPLILSHESDLWMRYEGILALASLSPQEALPLLRQSLSDPAAVVRRTIAYVAQQLFNKTALPELKELVHQLLSDPELIVRLHATRIFKEMSEPAAPARPSPADLQVLPLDLASAVPDLGAADLAALPPDLAHRVAAPAAPRLPVDAKWKEAAALESRALQEEKNLNYSAAMEYWDKLLKLKSSVQVAELQKRARAAILRLTPQVGRYRVHVLVDGLCVPEAEIHYEQPGNFKIKRKNKEKVVQLLPGKIIEAKLCL